MAAMNKPNDSFSSNRRTFIKKTTGAVTATSALAGVTRHSALCRFGWDCDLGSGR